MGYLFYDKPGPGIEKDAPHAKGLRLFFQILFREFFSIIKASCLFLLFSIPVVTLPAAYCAMSRITVSMVQDRPYYLWSDFWGAFRNEFGKATAAGLLLSGGMAAAGFAAYFYGGRVAVNRLYCLPFGVACLGFFWLLLTCFSVFTMLVLTDLPLRKVLKNAFLLVAPSLGCVALSLIACAALLFAAFCFFPYSLLPAALIYPALFNLIATFGAYGKIKRYVVAERGWEEG